MNEVKHFLVIIFLLFKTVECVPFTEKYIKQYIDHFRYYNNEFDKETFSQRYLMQDKWWKSPDGPIFFYTGNEGNIDMFWSNTGFVFDIAEQFGALIVFAEHRYYGKSMPFDGDQNFEHPYVDLLTVEQALADYAVLVTELRNQLNATGPVIAFGGSYGGMLTAYMRFKYPNVIAGGIAASAPVFLVAGETSRSFFYDDVTKDFRDSGIENCEGMVREGFDELMSYANSPPHGYKVLTEAFSLCSPITNTNDIRQLIGYIRNAFANIAMADYPYPTGLIKKLPGNPVKVACQNFLNASTPIMGLASVPELYYGSGNCHDMWSEYVECADPTGCGTGPGGKAWDYQACTEFIMPAGSNNVSDMFPVLSFTLEERDQYCEKRWQLKPRNDWIAVEMWGKTLKSATNLVFSNGDLDPWHRGGVLSNVSDSVIAVIIEGGAHHLDLRAANPLDPPSVKIARQIEINEIHKWIQEYHTNKQKLKNEI